MRATSRSKNSLGPHDTGMVTLATQHWSEFALHARAILGLPITQISRHSDGASVALKARSFLAEPKYKGLEQALKLPNVDVQIFGKPNASVGRRLGVVLATGKTSKDALNIAPDGSKQIEIFE